MYLDHESKLKYSTKMPIGVKKFVNNCSSLKRREIKNKIFKRLFTAFKIPVIFIPSKGIQFFQQKENFSWANKKSVFVLKRTSREGRGLSLETRSV